jgi:hypothetical protein
MLTRTAAAVDFRTRAIPLTFTYAFWSKITVKVREEVLFFRLDILTPKMTRKMQPLTFTVLCNPLTLTNAWWYRDAHLLFTTI